MALQRLNTLIPALGFLFIGVIADPAKALSAKNDIIFEAPTANSCPSPVINRLVRHQVKPGETIESIAQRYNLIPATLMGLNPSLTGGRVTVGSQIWISPYNGIFVEVPAGKTFRDVAQAYNLRPDVLFEINGCQANPKVVFVPGVNWSPNPPSNNQEVRGYPLPVVATVGLDYGWQLHPIIGEVIFHSGIDLLATVGTPVLAAGDGVVAFSGGRGEYGNLVVINHQGGLQTRYANLASIAVKVGQNIKKGQRLGVVGTTGKPDTKEPSLHFELRYNSNLGWVAQKPQFSVSSRGQKAEGRSQ